MSILLRVILIAFISIATLNASFLEEESARAIKEKKLILLNIETQECPYCAKMKKEIFNNPQYRKEINKKFVFVSIHQNDPSLPMDLRTPYVPANAIIVPSTKAVVDAYVGYIEPTRFMEILEDAYKEGMK